MNSKSFPAHIKYGSDGEKQIQTVKEHCEETARYASEALKDVGLSDTAYLAGLLHDLGKYTEKYVEYIENVTDPHIADRDKMKRGSVNHTFAGVKYILDTFHAPKCQSMDDVVAEIIAYAIGAHHGLFDAVDENGKNGFYYRQTKDKIFYDEAVSNFHNFVGREEVKERFQKSIKEIENLNNKLGTFCRDSIECEFYYGMLARLILSAVIEGDRRSTAEFMDASMYSKNDMCDWQKVLNIFEQKRSSMPQNSDINRARSVISDDCLQGGTQQEGIYRLNVPTGGGKTLSSLRYALKHAQIYGKNHIYYVMPLLAIIEQNAGVIRDFVGDDNLILEHHSDVINSNDKSEDELNRQELLVETWDAPIIITTLVQLLNTLFEGRTTSIRRFQSLCNSVIVFDEVQTVPTKVLTLFNLTCNFLSKICKCTIVLCSATQPCLEKMEHSIDSSVKDLIRVDNSLEKIFRRTKIIDKGVMKEDRLSIFIQELMTIHNSVLVICNTKHEATYLYRSVNVHNKVFLSGGLCTAHRKKVVETIKSKLGNNDAILCISTQVIEAGVDVSFGCVVRLCAGMDSIVQAAGRCNRNGESLSLAPVYIVSLQPENLQRLKDIECGKNATENLIATGKVDDELKDLAGPMAINFYYKDFYSKFDRGHFDFSCRSQGFTIFDLLSRNKVFGKDGQTMTFLKQAFKEAGNAFEVIDTSNKTIIVPYGDGERCIADLCSEKAKYDLWYLKKCLKRAKGYTVSVFDYQMQKLLQQGALKNIGDNDIYCLIDNAYYDEQLGLVWEPQNTALLFV